MKEMNIDIENISIFINRYRKYIYMDIENISIDMENISIFITSRIEMK